MDSTPTLVRVKPSELPQEAEDRLNAAAERILRKRYAWVRRIEQEDAS